MIEVELAHHVPLVRGPLRTGMRRDLRSIVFERKAGDFIGSKGTCVEADVLIAGILRRMLFRVAPPKLHGSLSANRRSVEVIADDTSCDRFPIDEDLDSGSVTGTVV